jgi:tRNA A-37 threonylcarbamoyl transferase component Bud32
MSLDRTAWRRLDGLLEAALDVPEAERGRWMDEACGSDASLRRELERLLDLALAADEPPLGALSTPTSPTPAARGRERDVPLQPGQVLGRYEILSLLGAGGMGRVYRALDTSLGREVAIKALAHAFRHDAASLRRFEREARLLATITHPNVATIHGFEMLDGSPYLVLELVEGRTLQDRLEEKGALPLEEATAIAVEVAEALQEAHRNGVVHRDLKPSNVMLAAAGRVKVLDFGIAKAVRPPGEEASEHGSQETTASGTVLGTAPYMSPEQVRGEEVDTRTDVWAFGCLVYEMLAGRRVFAGSSVPDIQAAILRDEPDWTALPADLPAPVRRMLRRCLRKDLQERLQDVGDARLELAETEEEPAAPPVPRARTPFLVAALVAVLAAAGTWLALGRRPAPVAKVPRLSLSLELPRGQELADHYMPPFAITPDGERLVLVLGGDRRRLHVRALGDAALRPLEDTEGAYLPFTSPDGRSVAFFADFKLKRVALDGGPAAVIAEVGGNPRGGLWLADGTIVLAPSQTSGLARISERAGALTPLTQLGAGEQSHRWPQAVPDGTRVLFTVAPKDQWYDDARLETVHLQTGERKVVLEHAAQGWLTADGRSLVYSRGGRLHAVPVDPASLEPRGPSRVVRDGVRYDPRNGGTHFVLAANGTAVHTPGVPTANEHFLDFVDQAGTLQRLVDVPRVFRYPRLSPDGRRVALTVSVGRAHDVHVLELATSTYTRLTFNRRMVRPCWTPDGQQLVVAEETDSGWRLLRLDAAAPGDGTVLLEAKARTYPDAVSPDGRFLVLQQESRETGWDLLALPLQGEGRLRPIAATPFHEANAALSPDGRFVAYESDELDDIVEVYVRSFPDGGGKVRASTTGARWPRFGKGLDLYYWYSYRNYLQHIRGREQDGSFVTADARPVWPQPPDSLRRLFVTPNQASYDVDPRTRRFVMLETSAAEVDAPFQAPVVDLGFADDVGPQAAP